MICFKCGTENPDNFKYCGHCGEPLKETHLCPNCGSDVPSEATFCPNCGASIYKEVLPQIDVIWDLDEDNILDLDRIKIIYSKGYDIEAEILPNEEADSRKRTSCLSIEFMMGRLSGIEYIHPNSQVALRCGIAHEFKFHLFRASEETGRILHSHVCYDNTDSAIDDDEWWKKYGDMFYKDVEPYRQRLKEFFGFDIIEDRYWEEKD